MIPLLGTFYRHYHNPNNTVVTHAKHKKNCRKHYHNGYITSLTLPPKQSGKVQFNAFIYYTEASPRLTASLQLVFSPYFGLSQFLQITQAHNPAGRRGTGKDQAQLRHLMCAI